MHEYIRVKTMQEFKPTLEHLACAMSARGSTDMWTKCTYTLAYTQMQCIRLTFERLYECLVCDQHDDSIRMMYIHLLEGMPFDDVCEGLCNFVTRGVQFADSETYMPITAYMYKTIRDIKNYVLKKDIMLITLEQCGHAFIQSTVIVTNTGTVIYGDKVPCVKKHVYYLAMRYPSATYDISKYYLN